MKDQKKSNLKFGTPESIKIALEALKSSLSAENYTVPKILEAEGKTTEWFQSFLSKVPKKKMNKFSQAFNKELSPMAAIKLHCEQCIGFDNAQESIKDCRGYTCPLYAYRPYQ